MAIQKEYLGYPEAYWVVSKVVADKNTATSCCRLEVFASALSKSGGDPPLIVTLEEWDSESYAVISTGGIPAVYGKLKEGKLQGGIDV